MAYFNPGQEQAPAQASGLIGNPNLNQYIQYYNNLVQANSGGGQASAYQPEWQYQAPALNNEPIQEQNQWVGPSRDLSTVDRFFAEASRFAEGLAGSTGFEGFGTDQGIVNDVGRFALQLPLGMASAPFSGAASLYEGVTGRPVTEANLETNKMSEEDLTGFQRLGSIGTGLADTVGLLIGGSAEAGNALFNAARTALGRPTKQAFGLTGRKLFGEGAGAILADTVEEAGEEAFQSVMEDIRAENLNEGSFGRALEQGAYGALGGAGMSGFGQSMNRVMGAEGPKANVNIGDAELGQVRDTEWGRNTDPNRSGSTITQGYASYVNDLMSQDNEVPGGVNGVQVTSSNRLSLIDAELGQQLFVGATQSSVDGSLDAIAGLFDNIINSYSSRTDGLNAVKGELENIASMTSASERANAYNDLLARNGGIRIKVNRTPNSNDGEISDFNVVRVNSGAGISLHPLAWTVYGSDVDGDRMTIFFNNNQESQGYLTRNLMSANGNKINYSEDYASFLTDKKEAQDIAIETFNETVDAVFAERPDIATTLKNDMLHAYKNKDYASMKAGKSILVTNVLNNFRVNYITSRTVGEETAEIRREADNALSNLMTSMVHDVAQSNYSIDTSMDEYQEAVIDGLKETLKGMGYESAESIQSAGDWGGDNALTALVNWGVRIAQTTTKNNPFYRQFPQIYAATQERGGIVQEMFYDPGNVFDTLFANLFRLVDVSFDVETAIESVYIISIQDQIRARLQGRKLGANGQISLSEFIEIFLEIRNNVAKQFNDAWVSQNTRSKTARLPGAPNPKPLDITSDKIATISRELLDIFGGYSANEIFVGAPDIRIIDLVAEDADTGQNTVRFGIGDALSLWKNMVNGYHGRSYATATRVEDMLEGYSKDIAKWIHNGDIAVDVNGSIVLNDASRERLRWMVQAFQEIFGYDVSRELGIHTVEGFIGSTWGKAFMSGDHDSALNAIISTKLTGLYSQVFEQYEDYFSDDPDTRERARKLIRLRLAQCQGISLLHDEIFNEFEFSGKLDQLIYFTDLNISYAEKNEKFNLISEIDSKENALLDYALRTTDSKVEMSKISQSLRRSEGAWRQASVQMGEAIRQEVDKLDRALSQGTPLKGKDTVDYNTFFAAVKYYGESYTTEFSPDILGAIAFDAGRIAKPSINKGAVKDSSNAVYLENALTEYGEQIASLDVMPIDAGILSRSNFYANRTAFIKCLTDPEASLEVWDPSSDERWSMSQKEIYSAYGIDIGEGPADGVALMSLIKQAPQIATYIVPQTFNVVYSGSEQSVTQVMARMPIDAIVDYARMLNDKRPKTSINRTKNFIKNRIYQNPKLMALTIASDPNYGSYKSMNHAMSSVSKALDSVVSEIMARGYEYSRSDIANVTESQKEQDDIRILTNMNKIINRLFALGEITTRNQLNSETLQIEQREQARDSLRDLLELPPSFINDDSDPEVVEKMKMLRTEARVILCQIVSDGVYNKVFNMAENRDLVLEEANALLESDDVRVVQAINQHIGPNATAEDIANLLGDPSYVSKMEELLDNETKMFIITDEDIELALSSPINGWNKLVDKAEAIVRNRGLDIVWEEVSGWFDGADRAQLMFIKDRLNHISLIHVLNDINGTIVSDVNTWAAYQEAQARDILRKESLKIYQEMVQAGISPHEVKSDLKFHFDDRVHGFGFTDSLFDLGGGGIPSFISNNAQKTKLFAAAGIVGNMDCGYVGESEEVNSQKVRSNFTAYIGKQYVDETTGETGAFYSITSLPPADHKLLVTDTKQCLCAACKTHARKANKNVGSNQFGDMMRSLVNHIMEPLALRLKKTYGDKDCIFRPMVGKSYRPTEVTVGTGDLRTELLKIRRDAVMSVQNNFLDLFNSKDYADLNFGEDESYTFASFVTPFLKLNINIRGERATVIVPSMSLASEETFNDVNNEVSVLLSEGGEIEGATPVIMSIDEACAHVLRDIDRQYWDSIARGTMAKDAPIGVAAEKWTAMSLRDFSSYKTTRSCKELIDSLPYRGYTNNMGMFPTNPSTPMMNWLGIDLDSDFIGASYSRVKKVEQKLLNEKQRFALDDELKQIAASGDDDLGEYLVSYATIINRPSSGDIVDVTDETAKPFDKYHTFNRLTSSEMADINASSYQEEIINEGTSDVAIYKLAEFYFGDGYNVVDSFKHAFTHNHAFICSEEHIETILPENNIANETWRKIKNDAYSNTITINGSTYCVIDPFDELARMNIGRMEAVSAIEPLYESGKRYAKLVVLDAPDIIGDSAIVWDPSYEDARRFYGAKEFGSVENYFDTPRLSSFKIADEQDIATDELKSIDDNRISWAILDFKEKNLGIKREKKWYKSAVQAFLDQKGKRAGAVSDGDCIGFIRMETQAGPKYAPVFYEGSGLPAEADSVTELGFKDGQVSAMIDARNLDITKISSKWMFDGFAYKCVGKDIDPDAFNSLPKLNVAYGVDRNGYIDFESAKSRFKGNETLQLAELLHNFTNDLDCARMHGANLFFNISGNAVTFKPELDHTMTLETLLLLQKGDRTAWQNVINSKQRIFNHENREKNDMVKWWAKHLLPMFDYNYERLANFFCPSLVFIDGYNHADGTIEGAQSEETAANAKSFVNSISGIRLSRGNVRGTKKTIQMLFNNVGPNRILGIYNIMTNGVCPPSRSANAEGPEGGWLIDAYGMMKLDDGSSGRVMIDVPIPDVSHSEHFTANSYTGNLSFQATAKRIMADGYFIGDQETTMARLSTAVENYEHIWSSQKRKWYEKALNDKLPEPELNYEITQRANLRRNEPIVTARFRQYRQECNEYLDEFYSYIKIVKEYGSNVDAFEDREFANRMQSKLVAVNKAMGYNAGDMGAVVMDELKAWAKGKFGYSKNNGKGFSELTADQFESCVDSIIESLSSTGFLIDIGQHGYYTGARGDIRVPMGLLPRNVAIRVFEAPAIKEKLAQQDIHTFEQYQAKMVEDCKNVTMDVVLGIDNRAKRLAIMKMIDALCYSNGVDTISGKILGSTYMSDIMAEARRFGTNLSGYDEELADKYEEYCKLNADYFAKLERAARDRAHFSHEDPNAWGGKRVYARGTDDSIVDATLRNLATARRAMGVTNVMMFPANALERAANQGMQSFMLKLGQSGHGVYASDFKWKNYKTVIDASRSQDLIKIYAALRTAELLGIDQEFLVLARDSGDFDSFVEQEFKKRNAFDRYTSIIMDAMSGGKFMIDGQIRNFIDRFAMEAAKKAPWWMMEDANGVSVLEQRLATDPAGWFIDVLNGTATEHGADMVLARQCMNWAKRGDMAQRNLVSAIYTELARRSAGADFITAAFISPYFQYATNRLGRVLQWVAPISSFHYLAVEAVTKGFAKDWNFFGTGLKFSDMAFEDLQMQSDIREAITLDIMHLGPQLVALMLLGMGCFEPPEDEDKWGNFKEWTFCGIRVDANWWVEDVLGLAIPYACFGASVREGKPRFDLVINGLAYYLSNNPVTKVSDAVEALFDPFSELAQWYDNDVEGYAKAMGGPPSMTDMVMGRATSFGLSFASQFITPGFLRELYNAGLDYETSYKRIYKESATGDLVTNAKGEAKTQYTTYADAMVRKMTRNNPVMGFLADMIYHPETGYMAHEMPRTIIYDPAQMNALHYFSLYNDPYNKTDEKTDIEKDALAIEIIATLQSNDVSTLARQGFVLDYDTKQYVSKYIWDMIASLNQQWNEFQQSDYADFYVAGNGDFNEGRKLVNQLKSEHYNMVNMWKTLYYDKLWSDEFTVAKYNRKFSRYAQDDNGEWYATGMNGQPFFLPFTLGSGESPEGDWQFNMGRENDWQTESVVTGDRTGQRGLVPLQEEITATPDINSWSTDGTDTGLSDRAANKTGNQPSGGSPSGNGTDDSGIPAGSSGSRRTRSGSSGGGGGSSYPRSSGGSGGGSGGSGGFPNIYSHVNAPNISNPDTMRGARNYDANYDALRPNFTTKGSREAYKRSDI